MAQDKNSFEWRNPWDILGSVFGYFASANEVPKIVRMLHIGKLVPPALKRLLISMNSDSDFWAILAYTVLIVLILWWFFAPSWKRLEVAEDRDKDDWTEKAFKVLEKDYRWRMVRSFGFIWIRGVILDQKGVRLYGTFRRPLPPYWPPEPDRTDYIDRVTFKNGNGLEIQYSNDYTQLFVRRHSAKSDTFDQVEQHPPAWEEIKLLFVASNYFPYWWLRFLIKRLLHLA